VAVKCFGLLFTLCVDMFCIFIVVMLLLNYLLTPLNSSGFFMYRQCQQQKMSHFVHRACLCFLCKPQNKQRLFRNTILTDWISQMRGCVYCAVRHGSLNLFKLNIRLYCYYSHT
jgi:hypothetical protein